jgi:hypothetical protein
MSGYVVPTGAIRIHKAEDRYKTLPLGDQGPNRREAREGSGGRRLGTMLGYSAPGLAAGLGGIYGSHKVAMHRIKNLKDTDKDVGAKAVRILRHHKIGAGAAVGGGLALTGYGQHRANQRIIRSGDLRITDKATGKQARGSSYFSGRPVY